MKKVRSRELAAAARRVAAWRRNRRHLRAAMPDELWRLAAKLARHYSPAAVGKQLGIDPHRLKIRMQGRQATTRPPAKPQPTKAPKVVRLAPLVVSAPAELAGRSGVIEIEKRTGEKLRLDPDVVDLPALIRTFLEDKG